MKKIKFIRNFVSTYMENKAVRDSLLVGLMQAYISKLSGYNHPVYGTAVTNFFLSLAGTWLKQAVEFASANLGKSISDHHLQRIQAKKHPTPIIVYSIDDVIGVILKQFDVIRSNLGDPLWVKEWFHAQWMFVHILNVLIFPFVSYTAYE